MKSLQPYFDAFVEQAEALTEKHPELGSMQIRFGYARSADTGDLHLRMGILKPEPRSDTDYLCGTGKRLSWWADHNAVAPSYVATMLRQIVENLQEAGYIT